MGNYFLTISYPAVLRKFALQKGLSFDDNVQWQVLRVMVICCYLIEIQGVSAWQNETA